MEFYDGEANGLHIQRNTKMIFFNSYSKCVSIGITGGVFYLFS